MIKDISGYGNNAYLENGAQIQPASDVCGSKAILSPRGDILMEDFRLENKPKQAITIAARIRLQDTRGWHSIFSTAKTTNTGEIQGECLFKYFHFSFTKSVKDIKSNFPLLQVAIISRWMMGSYDGFTGIMRTVLCFTSQLRTQSSSQTPGMT